MASPASRSSGGASQAGVTLATDWDTLHSISLAAGANGLVDRFAGVHGRANHYVGALWFYELVRMGHVYASATVTFGGTPAPSAYVSLTLGHDRAAVVVGHGFAETDACGDTPATLAIAFAQEINRGSTGVWASASGSVLTITSRSMGLAGDTNTVAASTTSGGFTATASGRTSLGARTEIGARI